MVHQRFCHSSDGISSECHCLIYIAQLMMSSEVFSILWFSGSLWKKGCAVLGTATQHYFRLFDETNNEGRSASGYGWKLVTFVVV